MNLSKCEAGEFSCWDGCCDGGVNYGVVGVILGFRGTVIFIGRVGRYEPVLSPYQLVSRRLPISGSSPSISGVLSVGGIPKGEVAPSLQPVDRTSTSTDILLWPKGKSSDTVAEVEAICVDDSRN